MTQKQTLRKWAEKTLKAKKSDNPEVLSADESRRLIHELQVHQIELDLQNEELRRAFSERDVSRARYVDLYDLAPVGYCTLSEKGLILETNQTAATLLGVAKSALIKRSFTRFILPDDQDIWYRHRRNLFETGAPQACQLRLLRKDGASFWVQLAANLVQEDENEAPAGHVVLTNITDQKRIEEASNFLAQGYVSANHPGFFESLARYLGEQLAMDFVCIDKLDGDGLNARTVAVWCDGKFEDNVVYALKDTPCGDLVGKRVCCFPAEVCRLFPHDEVLRTLRAESYIGVTLWSHTGRPIGLIAVIGRRPMTNRSFAEALLKTVAVRAGGELERLAFEEALQKAHDELENRVIERTAELEMAMTALKYDEERFRTVADFTIDWESWIGPDGRYIYVSPSCKSICGYLTKDFYNDPSLLKKIIHPQDLPAWEKAIAEDLEQKGETEVDFRIITRGGEERWISYKMQTVYNRDGTWLGRRDSGRDISDRKREEYALSESQARFRSLVESTNDWVWETDQDGRYTYVSPKCVDLLGYTPEEVLGKFPYDFMPPGHIEKAIFEVGKILKAGKPFRGIERTCRHKEGHPVILETSGVPFFDSLGDLAGFRGIDRDITNRKELEAQALRTRHLAAIGELAAGVAHEINNPINGIINYAQILEDDATSSGGNPDIPRRIRKEGDRVAEIVKNLLYFSRQSSKDKTPVSLRPVLEDSLALFAAQLRKDGIHVVADIPEDIPLVMGNRQQLQQVFMNILGNSRHALLAKSTGENLKKRIEIKVRVSESTASKMVTVSFHDNGIGIAPGLLERIFDPFFSTKALGEGTGLGLSISYGIVRDHGGTLIVESQAGDYTLATVNLPASTAG